MRFRLFAWLCAVAVFAAAAPSAQAATITTEMGACTFPGAPADPAPGTNGNVNIAVCSKTITIDAITEVAITGPSGGLFAFTDPETAPAPGETVDALAAASLGLGLPAGTIFAGLTLVGPSTSQNFDETIDVLLSPSGAYISDPDDYSTWIAISGTVQVNVLQTTTVLNAYRLEAQIDTGMAAIPLPPTAALLLAGLGGPGAFRLRGDATPADPA